MFKGRLVWELSQIIRQKVKFPPLRLAPISYIMPLSQAHVHKKQLEQDSNHLIQAAVRVCAIDCFEPNL